MINSLRAVIATNRFGLGARPGETAAAAHDPVEWLAQQIKPQAPLAGSSSSQRYRDILQGVNDGMAQAGLLNKKGIPLYRQDVLQRVSYAVTSKSSFVERLVGFWSNHLAISIERPPVFPFAYPYENEAIRPYIFARFEDMVLASARHPAMLLYLDNVRSIGPDSRAAQRYNSRNEGDRPVGLNENYARELMELHTLGVNGGYTQSDVRNLAKILSGWSIDRTSGVYLFRDQVHEPGPQQIMDHVFTEVGEAQGIAAIRYLCRHKSTAQHVCTKLARHFIGDDPPAAAVSKLVNVYLQTGGDLAAVTRQLIMLEEAWQPAPLKYKSPYEHVVSALRLCGVKTIDDGILTTFEVLGQRIFSPPSPQGWPDTEAEWLSGNSLVRRIEWSNAMAGRLPGTLDARALADAALGPWLQDQTAFLLQGAPSPQAAMTLLFLSPEFQRR